MAVPISQVGGYLRRMRRALKSTTENYLARATAGGLTLRAVSLGLGLICHFLLTRSLGAYAYGLYAYVLAWVKALSVPATLGFDRLLVREVAVYRVRSDWAACRALLNWAERALFISAGGITLASVVVSSLIANSDEGLRAFRLAMLLLPLIAFLRFRQYVMLGMNRPVIGHIAEMIVHPLLLTVAVVIYLASAGKLTAAGAMGLNLAAACAALLVCIMLFERVLPRSVKESLPNAEPRVWRRSVMPLLLVSGAAAISGQIPVLTLGALQGAEAAGILSVAKRLADLLVIPAVALSAALAPTMATLWVARDTSGLQRTITKCARGLTLLTLPLALLFIIFGRPLLEIFGAPFVAGASSLALLCVGQVINMLVGSMGLLLVTTGHEREVAYISVVSALLNFGLCVLLILRWGMAGAAAGATLSLIIWNIWLAWRAWRLLGIRPTIFARLAVRPGKGN